MTTLSNPEVFLIRFCGYVVYRVQKPYVDKLVARNPLHFNLLSTSPEIFLTKTNFIWVALDIANPIDPIDLSIRILNQVVAMKRDEARRSAPPSKVVWSEQVT